MNYLGRIGILLMLIFCLYSCEDRTIDGGDTVVLSTNEINIPEDGGETTFIIQTNVDKWRIENLSDWITLDPTNGTESSTIVKVTVNTQTVSDRSEVLKVIAGNAEATLTVTQAISEYIYSLECNYDELSFKKGGNTIKIEVTTDAPEWKMSASADWVQFSPSTGGVGTTVVEVTADANLNIESRETSIEIQADYAPSLTLNSFQIGDYYPDYNTNPLEPDETDMERSATELAAEMKLGWNIGNTLEAIGGETAWGNPKVTDQLIKTVKNSGFNAIRIPCAWDQYLENQATAKIKDDWLNRVKEVVQMCMDNDMYVLLNIHWDGGWLENNVTESKQEENNAKQLALWQQIATHLRDFDDRLMFASANEPNVENAQQMAVLNSYHQTFINAVRSTGGKNSYRTLVVQGPSTDVEKTYNLWKTLPTDIPGRMMTEVHYYTPWNFCGLESDQSWGKMFYYWGENYHSTTDPDRNSTWGEESTVDDLMGKMNEQFVQKGIPVILGEFGATRRSELTGEDLTLHLESRAYYLEYVTSKSLENGLIPFYWDNGGLGNLASGIFNRTNNTVFDQQALNGLLKGAGL